MEIGFIGLGNMGAPMACNLIKAGHSLTVYNRSRDKAEALAKDGAKDGATVADTVAEAARHPVVITMLANDQALSEVVTGDGGVLSALPHGGILISMSTVSVAITRHLAELCRVSGRRFVAAPVFGRPEAAEAAKLFVAAAGPADAVETVTPLLKAIGQQLVVFGEEPTLAATVKIAGNFMLQSAVEAMSEALALVRKHGVDPAQFLEMMTGSIFNTPIYKGYGSSSKSATHLPVSPFRWQSRTRAWPSPPPKRPAFRCRWPI